MHHFYKSVVVSGLKTLSLLSLEFSTIKINLVNEVDVVISLIANHKRGLKILAKFGWIKCVPSCQSFNVDV